MVASPEHSHYMTPHLQQIAGIKKHEAPCLALNALLRHYNGHSTAAAVTHLHAFVSRGPLSSWVTLEQEDTEWDWVRIVADTPSFNHLCLSANNQWTKTQSEAVSKRTLKYHCFKKLCTQTSWIIRWDALSNAHDCSIKLKWISRFILFKCRAVLKHFLNSRGPH